MDIIISTTTATTTIYQLTDTGMDLINFLVQFQTLMVALLAGLILFVAVILIFKN